MIRIDHIPETLISSAVFSLCLWCLGVMLFTILEPSIGMGASASTTDTFIVRQQITGELSFIVPPADVVMVGALGGVTGGTATGSTYAVVQTNSPTGYTLDISFSNTPAMRGETTASQALRNYGSGATPTYSFNSSTSAQFGYTASASTTSDLAQAFLDNGSNACDTPAGNDTGGAASCWMSPSTGNYRIIDKGDAAASGATTSLTFRITVPSNPIPAVEEDYYTATATLTATNQ